MNRLFRIFLIFLLVIVSLFFILKTVENFKLNNSLKSLNDNIKLIKLNQFDNNNENYLKFAEEDFDKLQIPDRWNYRIECLKHFILGSRGLKSYGRVVKEEMVPRPEQCQALALGTGKKLIHTYF